jgi:plastocyanin
MQNLARVSLPALAVFALLCAGCGSGSDTTSGSRPTTPDLGGTVQVVMKSLAFSPAAVDATVGQTVTWTQQDSAPHNVTYLSGPRFASSGTLIRLGAKFSLRLTEPGTIHYFCSIHPWMKATIVVSP